MKHFGLQLWSIRNHFTTVESTRDAFERIASFGYSQIQTAGSYDCISPEKFRTLADEAGLSIVGTHYPWERICSDVDGTIRYHSILGAQEIGIGGYATPTYDDLMRFIEQFNRLAAMYARHGFTLSYHNHTNEFSPQFREREGKCKFEYLIDGLDPVTTRFNLDAAWVQLAGVDVRALLETLRGRVDILHIKDVQADYPHRVADAVLYAPKCVEIGRGNMNFPGIISCAEACGVRSFIVEDEVYSTGVPMESVAMSAAYIREHLLEKGE